jgi:dTDP-4-amino-4,6-dideoxygalactose transaminase
MDALQAAVLCVKLARLEGWTEARRSVARQYDELLGSASVDIPYTLPDVRHVYHLYVVRSQRRDDLLARLTANGVGVGIHYPVPLHRQPAYAGLGMTGDFPETDRAAAEVLSLPMYPELTREQVCHVADQVRACDA